MFILLIQVIETELRKLDADQGVKHVECLSGFLPESFSRRAGEHEAILLLLLIDRLIAKCDLLATQVLILGLPRYFVASVVFPINIGASK